PRRSPLRRRAHRRDQRGRAHGGGGGGGLPVRRRAARGARLLPAPPRLGRYFRRPRRLRRSAATPRTTTATAPTTIQVSSTPVAARAGAVTVIGTSWADRSSQRAATRCAVRRSSVSSANAASQPP